MAEDLTAAQLAADLMAAYAIPEPPPGAFTVADFAERTGRTRENASDVLYDLFNKGRVSRIKIGKKHWYYCEAQ